MFGPYMGPDGKEHCGICGTTLPHKRITCSNCGLEYDDCEDWSGPAHPSYECIEHLKERLKEK